MGVRARVLSQQTVHCVDDNEEVMKENDIRDFEGHVGINDAYDDKEESSQEEVSSEEDSSNGESSSEESSSSDDDEIGITNGYQVLSVFTNVLPTEPIPLVSSLSPPPPPRPSLPLPEADSDLHPAQHVANGCTTSNTASVDRQHTSGCADDCVDRAGGYANLHHVASYAGGCADHQHVVGGYAGA
ncbi:hypothetical protein ZIOFF_065813 [Zingiber officinale]|uniref:Uncharacterized protein n=1 Tax=Zingiber officinale TaxID=94328 RepID=A0A8J5EY56_ZINOF|nr:hypothetical protein ZIOFF_065813 [Zingiber officinale]